MIASVRAWLRACVVGWVGGWVDVRVCGFAGLRAGAAAREYVFGVMGGETLWRQSSPVLAKARRKRLVAQRIERDLASSDDMT